jgi:NAD(P)-dependent dehydrogenase (short-subunit alcohol dehydrogenase family)
MKPTALITGASRGLGLALARSLAADGWALVIDGRDDSALAAVATELAASTEVHAVAGDVADEAHRQALIAVVAAKSGQLDLVVHNASVLGPSPQPLLAEYPLAALEHVYAVNVFGPIRLTQLVVPHLAPGAAVVVVTSDAAVEGYEGWSGYGSSKAAVEQAFNVFAAERPDLHVYRIDPGDMNTRMHQEAFPGEDISDRPPPEASVPGLRAVLDLLPPSGRYAAHAAAESASESATDQSETVTP